MKKIAGMIALLVLPQLAFSAQPVNQSSFNYNYVEGGYYDLEEEEGLGARASLVVAPNVYIAGELALLDNIDVFKIGAGYYKAIKNNVDLFGQLMFVDFDYDDGFNIRGGARAQLDPKFELGGGLTYYNLEDSEVGFFVNGLYDVAVNVDLLLEIESVDDQDLLLLGARYHF